MSEYEGYHLVCHMTKQSLRCLFRSWQNKRGTKCEQTVVLPPTDDTQKKERTPEKAANVALLLRICLLTFSPEEQDTSANNKNPGKITTSSLSCVLYRPAVIIKVKVALRLDTNADALI